jgi:hypothetical protein
MAQPKPQTAAKSTENSPTVAAYRKAMEDRLGPIWYQLVRIHENELSVGRVSTTFEIPAAGGRPRHVEVVSNTEV